MKIKAVFLDAGGTLFRVFPSVGAIYQKVLKEEGIDSNSDKLEKAFQQTWKESTKNKPVGADRYSMIKGGEKAYWQTLTNGTLTKSGINCNNEVVLKKLISLFSSKHAWQLYPETVEVLEKLNARGYHVGIISNWDSTLPLLLKSLDIEKYFHTITVSIFEKKEKPSPIIFNKALQLAKVDSYEAIHIGDRVREDYIGAKAMGINALVVDRAGTFNSSDSIPDLNGIFDRL